MTHQILRQFSVALNYNESPSPKNNLLYKWVIEQANAACCMFNSIIKQKLLPKYLSSDNDPIFRYHRWKANLSILDIEEIKSIPYTPTSHPFVERLIGTVRREYIDCTLFWNERDLMKKLNQFKAFYNQHRTHSSISGKTPEQVGDYLIKPFIGINQFHWDGYCNNMFQLPVAA